MSDSSVADALRSAHRLVVIEAPAGCGKTYQASEYARERAAIVAPGRLLILTHTHAACDVIAARTRSVEKRVEIRTIDSLISQIGTAYHLALGLPGDAAIWARTRGSEGYAELASKVALLLQRSTIIVTALLQRYPIVVCDEHQDSSAAQHAVVLALMAAGAQLRVFGDPMQRIYSGRKVAERKADAQRWTDLLQSANVLDKLDTPHRWGEQASPLGHWILRARETLRAGGKIDLRADLPQGVQVVVAENQAKRHGLFQMEKEDRKPIDTFVRCNPALLILTRHNDAARGLRAFFNRTIPIWEGHTRDALGDLVKATKQADGDAEVVTRAMMDFLGGVARGFTPSSHGDALVREIASQCSPHRKGKSGALQQLARMILDAPDHKGVGRVLRQLEEFIGSQAGFEHVSIDLRREFWDAMKLAEFDDADTGLSEIARMRTYTRRPPPKRAISTIHKAKGLECDAVLVMPCDAKTFSNQEAARCLLYVALSRARRSLMLVLSREQPSPLFELG